MKTLLGGAIAAALGLIGVGIWWQPFLTVLTGVIPAILLLGGALAIYLGFDELKDSLKKDVEKEAVATKDEEVETYKKEIDNLKGEIDSLKKEE